MKALTIVEYHDVLKDSQAGLPACGKALQLDTLGAHGTEESLGHGVIVGITFAAHAHADAIRLQKRQILIRCVLAAAVGMMDQRSLQHALAQRHAQGRFHERLVAPGTHGEAHDPTREGIQQGSHIQPAFIGPDAQDIAHPLLGGRVGTEVTRQHIRRNWPLMIAVGGSDTTTHAALRMDTRRISRAMRLCDAGTPACSRAA